MILQDGGPQMILQDGGAPVPGAARAQRPVRPWLRPLKFIVDKLKLSGLKQEIFIKNITKRITRHRWLHLRPILRLRRQHC
jgi:hypothetical protein